MVNRKELLEDLKRLLKEVEADLRARCNEVHQIDAGLQKEYALALAADRTGITFEEWRLDLITQVAVAWVLSCVFARFLEDNALITPPRISGPLHGAGQDAGLQRARDEREAYFKTHPKQTDREYLLSVLDGLANLPGTKDVFGVHNPALAPAYRDWLSGDAAQMIIEFFQKIDTDGTGELVHDFTDPEWDTRFLGDLYQDLSEAARKKYALLQTPIFVEEFILERTLEPAIQEFGLKDFKMIDPACGSGHFLLGSFARILAHWRKAEPGAKGSDRELVNRTLAAVHGVDLNPYAIAIARFRLLLVAMRECHLVKLSDAPNFAFNLACGDSLLHGKIMQQSLMPHHALAHAYQAEDLPALERILAPGTYHAVVANPPYITVKDKVLNVTYRKRYPEVCHMQYSVAVPFLQRIVELSCPRGFSGQITANSFMKREFGKKLIERYLPTWDLTHVIDTSGAYIPGHGTPTVILFGRSRKPISPTLRTAMGIAGEPATPDDPADGLVWAAIVRQLDQPGSTSTYISVNDSPRNAFQKHPWSIGGGGASELKEMLDDSAVSRMNSVIDDMGRTTVVGEDDAWIYETRSQAATHSADKHIRPLVIGECVRDWTVGALPTVIYPYKSLGGEPIGGSEPIVFKTLWYHRTTLARRTVFGKSMAENRRHWWEHLEHYTTKLRTPLSIVFGFVATHNHFVLERGGKVFNRSAPIIKLPRDANEDHHFGLLGLLNSSTGGFWLKQVSHNKGSSVDQHGARQRTAPFEDFWEFTTTQLESFPLPTARPLDLSRQIDALAREYAESLPDAACRRSVPDAAILAHARETAHCLRARMIALQEELDWQCYHLYGLLESAALFHLEHLPSIRLGQRAFEIVMARQMAAGEVETTWFVRHSTTPITEIPKDWPAAYRDVVQKRIDLIQSHKNIGLIEKPEYKRRWNTEPWDEQQEKALRGWLLDRLESYFDLDGRMNDQKKITATGDLGQPKLTSLAKLADVARQDKEFMQVAELFAGRVDFDVGALVAELVTAESVPALPILRYKPAGLDKRKAWERTWELQREEDRLTAEIEALESQWKQSETSGTPAAPIELKIKTLKSKIPRIPVPPKYTSADFLLGNVWRLRGKLDVPKERWVSFPHCEGEDGTLVIAWAGYDHLQLARAIAERYELAKEQEGRKLVPLLAAIGQLIAWLKQWHNDLDMSFGGTRMGNYFEEYLDQEAKAIGQTVEQAMAWTPPTKAKKTKRTNVPAGAGGFPDNNRDVLLLAAGLAIVGPNGISEELHLDAMILLTAPERCRAIIADDGAFDRAMKGIDDDFWTDTSAKWKQTRNLLRQVKAIDIDPHSGLITRNEPVFSKLRDRYGKSLDELAQIAIEAARKVQTATSNIQRSQQKSRTLEQEAA